MDNLDGKNKCDPMDLSSTLKEKRLDYSNSEFSKINYTTENQINESETRATAIKLNNADENTVCTNNSFAMMNGANFSNSPIQQYICQSRRQRNKIYSRIFILQSICQNRDINIFIQQMKLLNCNKKRRRFEDSVNCKIAIGDGIACGSLERSKKYKDRLENALSMISKFNKTRATWSLNNITQFIEILGLSELISREKTRDSEGGIPSSSFEITEKYRNKSFQILRKKPFALIETVLKVLKMKNYPKLLSIIKPSQKPVINRSVTRKILRIAIRKKAKILHKDNMMIELPKLKDLNTANIFITENNCLNEKSTHFEISNDSNKCNFDFKEKINDENKECVNPNKLLTTSENSTIHVEKDLKHTQTPIKLMNSPNLPKKIIDLRSIKCSSSQKLDRKINSTNMAKDKITEIKSNEVKSSPTSAKLNEDTTIHFHKSGDDPIPRPSTSNNSRTYFNINLTRANYLQRKSLEPVQSTLTGPNQSVLMKGRLLCKRINESNLENTLDHSLAKRKSSDFEEKSFDNNVILTSTPCLTTFNNVLEERMKDSQNMVLQMYNCKKNTEVKNELAKYEKCLSFLELRQHYELTNCYDNYIFFPIDEQIRVQLEHRKQRLLLEQQLIARLKRLENKFKHLLKALQNRQRKVLNHLEMTFNKNSLKSTFLTIPLRKGPTRENKSTICYQHVTAIPSVIVTLLREDEVYDAFYSHKISWDKF